jgi:hypothetical protein
MVAGDHNHARLGEDVLQLVDQIGFLRSIHANSKNSRGIAPERASTKAQANLSDYCPWGWGSLAPHRCNARRSANALRMIPVPV